MIVYYYLLYGITYHYNMYIISVSNVREGAAGGGRLRDHRHDARAGLLL